MTVQDFLPWTNRTALSAPGHEGRCNVLKAFDLLPIDLWRQYRVTQRPYWIDQIRNNLIKRFENIVALAAVDETNRNATALSTYQMRIETAGLIRNSEDILSLSRQLQDLWLFGQLKTLEGPDDRVAQEVDDVAKEVSQLLAHVVDQVLSPSIPTDDKVIGHGAVNGDSEMGESGSG